MTKLLRYIVHTLEIFMWEQDYFLLLDEGIFSEDFFVGDFFDKEELTVMRNVQEKEPEGSPAWRVRVEYTNHTTQDTCSYDDYLPERPKELYFSLLEYFEIEDDDLDIF